MSGYGPFMLNSTLFCVVLGVNLAVGFTPFTIACVVFTGLMVLLTLILAVKTPRGY